MKPPRDQRWTVMLVPECGRGPVRQVVVARRQLVAAASAAGLLVVGLAGGAGLAAWTAPRALERDAVVAENTTLRADLERIEERLARMDALVARVAAFDDQLRDAARDGALPGSGPLSMEEARLFEAWLDDREEVSVAIDRSRSSTLRAAEAVGRLEAIEADLDALSTDLDALEARMSHLAERRDALPQMWPLEGVITSEYGMRRFPFGGHWSFHSGIDIGVAYGTPIVATADGIVTLSRGDASSGRAVEIDHGAGVSSRYGHCSVLIAQEGDDVRAGQLIAYSGNSGLSTGPHLHYTLRIDGEAVDPLEYLP